MANPILAVGGTGSTGTNDPIGALTVMGGLTAENLLLEFGAATDFRGLSLSVLAAYTSDGGGLEAGGYVGTSLFSPPNVGFGGYAKGYFKVGDSLQMGPLGALNFGYGTSPAPFGGQHNYQTAYCPGGDSGIFGNDQGTGGCENRPLGPDGVTEPGLESAFGVSAVGMGHLWWNITEKLVLDAGVGPTVTFTPKLGIDATFYGRLLYAF